MRSDVCEWCGWPVDAHTDGLDEQGHPIVVCLSPVKSGFPRRIWGPGAPDKRPVTLSLFQARLVRMACVSVEVNIATYRENHPETVTEEVLIEDQAVLLEWGAVLAALTETFPELIPDPAILAAYMRSDEP